MGYKKSFSHFNMEHLSPHLYLSCCVLFSGRPLITRGLEFPNKIRMTRLWFSSNGFVQYVKVSTTKAYDDT